MDDRPMGDLRARRLVRLPAFLVAAAAVGLTLIVGALFLVRFYLRWTEGERDADIPPGRASAELARRLGRDVGVTIDPADIVVLTAHETRGGRDGGDEWFRVRLKPEAAARFEAHFLATIRARARPGHLIPFAERVADWHALRGLGPGPDLPPGARAWWLDERRSTCVVFFDDQFYFYLDDF